MPVYTITHSQSLSSQIKADLAREICDAHTSICAADPKYVNVRFIKIAEDDGFTAGNCKLETGIDAR